VIKHIALDDIAGACGSADFNAIFLTASIYIIIGDYIMAGIIEQFDAVVKVPIALGVMADNVSIDSVVRGLIQVYTESAVGRKNVAVNCVML